MGNVLNNISPSNMFITLHPLVRFHKNYQFVLYDGAEFFFLPFTPAPS